MENNLRPVAMQDNDKHSVSWQGKTGKNFVVPSTKESMNFLLEFFYEILVKGFFFPYTHYLAIFFWYYKYLIIPYYKYLKSLS